MKIIELPRLVPKPRSGYIQPLSLLLAVILLVMAVAQLFKYEAFPEALNDMGVAGGFAPLIVTLEVAALPFLLFMSIGSAGRLISMIAGWAVVSWWVVASLIATLNNAKTSGFLGAAIELPSGWWSVFFALSLAVLMAWVSWGMWPYQGRK